MGKSKETERKLAQHYYCEKGMSPQDVADKTGVSRSTVDRWIEANGWDALRAARHSSKERQLARLNELLERQVERMLELENDPDATDDALTKLNDRLSKTNKAIETARYGMEPPLSVQLRVIENFMDSLLRKDGKLYTDLIEFQEHYIYELSDKLG